MKIIQVVVAAGALFLLPGRASEAGSPATAGAPAPQAAIQKKINDPASIIVPEAKKMLETRKDLLLVDVRSPLEFSQGFIKGSRNIPFIDLMEGRFDLPKDKPILLICSIGGRSFAAVQILKEKGYKEIYNLDGGIEAWRRASLPVQFQR